VRQGETGRAERARDGFPKRVWSRVRAGPCKRTARIPSPRANARHSQPNRGRHRQDTTAPPSTIANPNHDTAVCTSANSQTRSCRRTVVSAANASSASALWPVTVTSCLRNTQRHESRGFPAASAAGRPYDLHLRPEPPHGVERCQAGARMEPWRMGDQNRPCCCLLGHLATFRLARRFHTPRPAAAHHFFQRHHQTGTATTDNPASPMMNQTSGDDLRPGWYVHGEQTDHERGQHDRDSY